MTSNEYVEAEGTISLTNGARTLTGVGARFITANVANGLLRVKNPTVNAIVKMVWPKR